MYPYFTVKEVKTQEVKPIVQGHTELRYEPKELDPGFVLLANGSNFHRSCCLLF